MEIFAFHLSSNILKFVSFQKDGSLKLTVLKSYSYQRIPWSRTQKPRVSFESPVRGLSQLAVFRKEYFYLHQNFTAPCHDLGFNRGNYSPPTKRRNSQKQGLRLGFCLKINFDKFGKLFLQLSECMEITTCSMLCCSSKFIKF